MSSAAEEVPRAAEPRRLAEGNTLPAAASAEWHLCAFGGGRIVRSPGILRGRLCHNAALPLVDQLRGLPAQLLDGTLLQLGHLRGEPVYADGSRCGFGEAHVAGDS